jgi:hypothetical protein
MERMDCSAADTFTYDSYKQAEIGAVGMGYYIIIREPVF